MSRFEGGRAGVNRLCVQGRITGRGRWQAAVVGGLLALAISIPQIAWAHPPVQCPETWNPAREPSKFTGVPGGTSTAPGTTTNGPINPDGFFRLVGDEHGLLLFNGCPGFGGQDDENGIEPFPFPGPGNGFVWPSGTRIKYTEANGIHTPRVDLMAGNNGNGNGNSIYIQFHLWGSGDLWICDAVDTANCTCCFVPPPPF